VELREKDLEQSAGRLAKRPGPLITFELNPGHFQHEPSLEPDRVYSIMRLHDEMQATASGDSYEPGTKELLVLRVRSVDEIDRALNHAETVLTSAASAENVPTIPGLWYRGCVRETYTLLPSLLRFDNGLDVELQLYERYIAKWARHEENRHWLALFWMQHFFIPTRLLDWTLKPEVAKYFALSSDDVASPTIFVLHPGLLNLRAFGESKPPFLLRTC
jgi:hypothetical protein